MDAAIESLQTTTHFPRFGELTYSQTDVIEFPFGLPGFPLLRKWLFLTLDSQQSFVWLQSIEDESVALPAANPWLIFETYNPNIPAHAFAAMRIAGASDFTLLGVMVVSDGARDMTMNLAAPILVNLRLRKAMQIALKGSPYGVCEPIPRKPRSSVSIPTAIAS